VAYRLYNDMALVGAVSQGGNEANITILFDEVFEEVVFFYVI